MNKRLVKTKRVRVHLQGQWRSKLHPYWFFRRYPDGMYTFQSMWLNVHISPKH